MDHWFQMEALGGPTGADARGIHLDRLPGRPDQPGRAGLLVTGVTYRHPGLLAKIVTTLDVLSGGRAFLGIGAAWYEREHDGLGVPFPSPRSASSGSRRPCRSAARCGVTTTGAFEGAHYRLAETVCTPQPIQPGGPPILVGGSGERKTLRLVAKYADACNLFGFEPDEMKHKIEVLDGHCADVGRDPADVQRTALAGGDPFEDPDGFLRRMEAYAALGIDQVWVMPPPRTRSATSAGCATRCSPRLREMG